MIDRNEFARVMGVFADRIGRALAPETAGVYFDTLSEALTTDEFIAGARVVFRAHQFNTWPAPQQFIDAVKPQPKVSLAAAEAFERVLQIMGDSSVPLMERKAQVLALGPSVERAFRAAGGVREFHLVLLDNVPWIRKRFVEACEAATTEESEHDRAQAALDRGALDPRVAGLVDTTAKVLTMHGRDRALPKGDR